MKKRYKLKRKNTLSALFIVLTAIVTLVVMNTGYALWSSKLNIHGTVTLNFDPPPIDVTVPSTGRNKYTTASGLDNGWFTLYDFVSDSYSENSLVTTYKLHRTFGLSVFGGTLTTRFTIRNSSNEGYVYTDGTVKQIEVSNPGSAASNVSASVNPKTIAAGNSAEFTFQAYIDRSRINSELYYKYSITYDVDGVTRYFFYTIRIIP